jgi:hypothetical protein
MKGRTPGHHWPRAQARRRWSDVSPISKKLRRCGLENELHLLLILHVPQNTTMAPTTYFLVSLPTSISQSNDKEEAFQSLRAAVSSDHGSINPFSIPTFKIGTLDALVQQADDLAKLEQGCEQVVHKIADSLKSLFDGDEEKLQAQKVVNDSKFTIPFAQCRAKFCVQDLWTLTSNHFSGTK